MRVGLLSSLIGPHSRTYSTNCHASLHPNVGQPPSPRRPSNFGFLTGDPAVAVEGPGAFRVAGVAQDLEHSLHIGLDPFQTGKRLPLVVRVDSPSWPRACAGAHVCVRGHDHSLVRKRGCTDTIELVRANYLQLWARETVPFRFFGNITGLRLMSLPGHRDFAPFRVPLTPPALVGMSVATSNIIVSRRDTRTA